MYDVSEIERGLQTTILKISKISETHSLLCATQPYFENVDYYGGLASETFQDKMNEFRDFKRDTYAMILSNAAKKVKISGRMLKTQDAYFKTLSGYDPLRNLWIGSDQGALKAFRKASKEKLTEMIGQCAVDISTATRVKPFFDAGAEPQMEYVVQSIGVDSSDIGLVRQNLLDRIYGQRLSSAVLSLYGTSLNCRLAMISHDAAVYTGCALRAGLFRKNSVPDVCEYINGELYTAQNNLVHANKTIKNLQTFITEGPLGMKNTKNSTQDLSFVPAGLDLVL